jgi:sec-independent protein translocase protein TatA
MRLGAGEIVIILVLALLFFGPSKLPQLGSSLGEALRSFKKGLSAIRDEVDLDAPAEQPKAPASQVAPRAAEPTATPAATPTADQKTPAK